MNKKEIAQQFTRARRSFSEGGKQMLDPNQPSISFEQVTNMLKEIEQTHSKVMSNTEAFRIQYRMLESLYSGLHFKLQGLHKPIENLEERLIPIAIGTSTRLSKYQQSSLWQRYWTAIVVGMISALLTNLIYHLI